MSEIDFQTQPEGFRTPDIEKVLEKLVESEDSIVGPIILYGLSDITPANLKKLKTIWDSMAVGHKHKLLVAMTRASETNFELSYRDIGLMSLTDISSLVRSAAVDLLWEDETTDTMMRFMTLAQEDDAPNVRARALIGLGKFILLGEYEEIPEKHAVDAQELAIALHKDNKQPLEVRRRALEALSNSSHKGKDKLIQQSYHSPEHLLKASAIFSMGRSSDEKWEDIVLDELDSSDNEIVYEAVRACGEIQLPSSVQQLGELTLEDDREIQMMAIWSLGEIGGRQALDILAGLQEHFEDEELLEVVDEALDVASFSLSGAMFDFDVDDI